MQRYLSEDGAEGGAELRRSGEKGSPKLSHSDMSLISFHMLTPRNHASLERCPPDNLKSAQSTAPGFGTSSCDRYRARACTLAMVSFDVAVMNGFS